MFNYKSFMILKSGDTRVVDMPMNEARGGGRGRSIQRRLRAELPPGTAFNPAAIP